MLETFLVLWGLAATASFFAQLRRQRYASLQWMKASKDLVDEQKESARLRNESTAKAAECVELKKQVERWQRDYGIYLEENTALRSRLAQSMKELTKTHNAHEALKLELQKLCGMKE